MYRTLAIGLCLCMSAVWTHGKLNGKHPQYTNNWAVKVRGGEEVTKRIARDLGYTYKGQLGEFKDYYKLVREDHPEVSLRDSEHLTHSLLDLDEVIWAKQQLLVKYVRHGLFRYTEEEETRQIMPFLRQQANKKPNSEYGGFTDFFLSHFNCIADIPSKIQQILIKHQQGDIRKLGTISTEPAPKSQLLGYSRRRTIHIGLISKKVSAYALRYDDTFWIKQWNMQDYRTIDMPVMDLNVVPVHKMGITGKGVTVAVVDDGVEHGHRELKDNVIEHLSYDYCKDAPGAEPEDGDHGTKCAGVIAMKPNNKFCGVGIAYDVNIVGIRMLCKEDGTEAQGAKALMHKVEDIDIYSNSWGGSYEGKYVYDIDHLTKLAFTKGTTEGRNKKGSIYVMSAGNDRDIGDNCAVAWERNHELFIVIAAADQFGKPTYYSERCTAVFATTYSKNGNTEGIVTSGWKDSCTSRFDGTSAACPQAAGIIALALEANPELTYRDVMHLIANSAEVAPLADNSDIWYKNGRGFWVSNDFGFGLMNAKNMVTLARTWENVPKKSDCTESVLVDPPARLEYSNGGVDVTFETSACQGTEHEVNYLEHIELASLVAYPYRGHIMVYITSPSGTRSQLLEPRYKDDDPDGLEGWSIMSTHNWGEDPKGKWTVSYIISERRRPEDFGFVRELTIKFHGTKDMPAHYKEKRKYAAFRLPNRQPSL